MKKTIAVLLICSLASAPILSHSDQTNSPPIHPETQTCHNNVAVALVALVVGGIMIYFLVRTCKRVLPKDPPPPPPPTTPPPNTNAPPHSASVQGMSVGTNNAEAYDISGQGWTDPWGHLYATFETYGIESSTNLHDWSESLRVNQYLSDVGVLTILLTNGVPIGTNYSLDFYGPTNAVFPLKMDEPQRFYRVAQ